MIQTVTKTSPRHILLRIGLLFLLSFSTVVQASGQVFFPSGSLSLVRSQVDGDNLTGYDKAGLRVGASLSIRLHNSVFAGIGLSYQSLGSKRQDVFQRRPNEGSEVEMDLSSIAVAPRLRFALSRVTSIGLELPLHAIFRAETVFVNNRVNVPQFVIEAEDLRTVSWSFAAEINFLVFDNVSIQVRFDRFMQNLLQSPLPIDNIRTLQPFFYTVGLNYDLIPFAQKIPKKRTRRSR